MSNFPFVGDTALRGNLDKAFDYIVDLISLSESDDFSELTKSSFRQTIIIYTSAIIEALLLHFLKSNFNEAELVLEKWELVDIKVLYEVDANHKIVTGHHKLKRTKRKLQKLNLDGINSILKSKNSIAPALCTNIDKVRDLRNDQHFGTHTSIKMYTKKDLEFVFSVAGKVKSLF
ncbi:MAG: hypothetical protein JKX80_02680 [Candidatus Pacebacteria bacterium]|nr:hypothetical protein [Candidatus Paceibacterota bacterium]